MGEVGGRWGRRPVSLLNCRVVSWSVPGLSVGQNTLELAIKVRAFKSWYPAQAAAAAAAAAADAAAAPAPARRCQSMHIIYLHNT